MSTPSTSPRRARHARSTSNPRPKRRRTPPAAPVSTLDAALNASQQLAPPPPRSFAELGLNPAVVKVLRTRGVEQPFAIQARALPDALLGRDVLARAQTGSGKTLAFGLPMLARLAATAAARRPQSPRGLVLVPTRELAGQVADELNQIATVQGLRITTVFGGASIGRQIEALRRGVDVIVATPGRLLDLMERNAARLDHIEIAVLDEADHMADLGFLPAVTKILDATPAGRQCLLFSATLDRGVDRLVTRYLTDPAIHAVASSAAAVDTMDHRVFVLQRDDKVAVAAQIASRQSRTLFFVRTKHGADRLARQLSQRGADAAAIHGNLNQNQRQRALADFASGRTRVLVATDVAARGIHVDDVDLVVHYDPPNDHKDYLHRSGRTARAGATGTVLSLVEHHQKADVARIHQAAAIRPDQATVTGDHPEVRRIAESGAPITVRALPAPGGQDRAQRNHRPPRRQRRRAG